MRVIGLLLQSLQHISLRPDHDAGMAEGGLHALWDEGEQSEGKLRGLAQ